jgi:pantothenate kinase-related protein Tda10
MMTNKYRLLFKKIDYDVITLTRNTYRMSQKWRTNVALRCKRDYRKRQKNVKKIRLDLFSDLAVFESGT